MLFCQQLIFHIELLYRLFIILCPLDDKKLVQTFKMFKVGYDQFESQLTVLIFDSCTKCPGIICNRTPDFHPVSWHGYMTDLTTERSFDSKEMWVIDVFGLSYVMLSMGVYTNRHWQTSGGQVQKLNVCTVCNIKVNRRSLKDQ